jgi:hypothetical protein
MVLHREERLHPMTRHLLHLMHVESTGAGIRAKSAMLTLN